MCQTPNLEVQGTVLAGHFPENQSGLVEPARRPVLKAASGIALGEAVLQFDLTGPGVLKCTDSAGGGGECQDNLTCD